MYHFFTDETNTSPESSGVKFFVYGGVIVPYESFDLLHNSVETIRKNYGLLSTDSLKFDSNSRPSHVTRENYTEAKKQIVRACLETDCVFIASVTHHGIARPTGLANTTRWATDCVLKKFHDFLEEKDGWGIVVRDRLPDNQQYNFLSEKFTQGLIYSNKENFPLERIKLFTSSCNNASHMNSIADIVLGSFRYCINNPLNEEAAKSMMAQVSQLFWAKRSGTNIFAIERGLSFRPAFENIRSSLYKKESEELLEHINSLLR